MLTQKRLNVHGAILIQIVPKADIILASSTNGVNAVSNNNIKLFILSTQSFSRLHFRRTRERKESPSCSRFKPPRFSKTMVINFAVGKIRGEGRTAIATESESVHGWKKGGREMWKGDSIIGVSATDDPGCTTKERPTGNGSFSLTFWHQESFTNTHTHARTRYICVCSKKEHRTCRRSLDRRQTGRRTDRKGEKTGWLTDRAIFWSKWLCRKSHRWPGEENRGKWDGNSNYVERLKLKRKKETMVEPVFWKVYWSCWCPWS